MNDDILTNGETDDEDDAPPIGLSSKDPGLLRLGSLAAGATKHAYFYLTASAVTTAPESHTISV